MDIEIKGSPTLMLVENKINKVINNKCKEELCGKLLGIKKEL